MTERSHRQEKPTTEELELNKETVQDLTEAAAEEVRGGLRAFDAGMEQAAAGFQLEDADRKCTRSPKGIEDIYLP